jgi:uncharacterized protein YndB with AHSA1/START domain
MSTPHKLTLTTPSDREIRITRTFDAPRRLVFDAWTRPELIRRWLLGPPGWTMTVCEVELRVGGAYRYVWRRDDGTTMGMGGVYREIVVPERWVATEKFDDYPGEALGTNVLTERAGQTTSDLRLLYASKAARDGALGSGMDKGMEAGFERLDALLASLEEVSR